MKDFYIKYIKKVYKSSLFCVLIFITPLFAILIECFFSTLAFDKILFTYKEFGLMLLFYTRLTVVSIGIFVLLVNASLYGKNIVPKWHIPILLGLLFCLGVVTTSYIIPKLLGMLTYKFIDALDLSTPMQRHWCYDRYQYYALTEHSRALMSITLDYFANVKHWPSSYLDDLILAFTKYSYVDPEVLTKIVTKMTKYHKAQILAHFMPPYWFKVLVVVWLNLQKLVYEIWRKFF